MKQIPETEDALVLRTDFSDQVARETICTTIREPVGDFRAYVEFLDDVEYRDVTKDQLLGLVPKDYNHSFIIVVDRTAISQRDCPLLIVDLYDGSGREFQPFRVKFSPLKITCRLRTWTLGNSPGLWMKTACFAASLRAEFRRRFDETAAGDLKNDSRLLTS
jgi:hypothetical protein